jgi:hypothetical protein
MNTNKPLYTGLVLLTLLCGHALGQTALGNGRGLEKDLAGRGVGNAPRPDFMAEVRMRNDLVTGNATGGRAFRGNAGYKSGDDFRGSLGSDDLFSFRRDTLLGGANGSGFRGTSGLQYQYSYSTSNQFGQSTLSNMGGATNASKLDPFVASYKAPKRVSTDLNSGSGEGWNALSYKLGTMRSTSTFNTTSSLNPAVIGERAKDQNIESMTASSLMGIRTVTTRRPDAKEVSSVPITAPVKPADRLNKPAGPQPVNPSRPGDSVNDGKGDEIRTAYSELVDRLAKNVVPVKVVPLTEPATDKPAEGTDANTPLWESQLSKLRQQLESARTTNDAAAKKSQQLESVKGGKNDRDLNAKPDESKAKPSVLDYDPDAIELIRSAGGEVKSFTTQKLEKDLYTKYMTEGSEAMSKHKYFDAEELFSRCLAMSPGDPTASAARINAQLGGSLFLSAAVNLHALLEKHPEVACLRYSGETIPSTERLNSVAIVLRERISDSRKAGFEPGKDAGFLLAYIGFQIQDQAMVKEGIAALDAANTASGPQAGVLELIRKLWLSPAQPATK